MVKIYKASYSKKRRLEVGHQRVNLSRTSSQHKVGVYRIHMGKGAVTTN